jgi:hypothetical protein
VELLQEKAANLGRMGRRLEGALEALRGFEAPGAVPRDALVADAAEALFLYVVQREVCGLRDTRVAMDVMRVPPEVRLRMGPRSAQRRSPRPGNGASVGVGDDLALDPPEPLPEHLASR